MRHKKLKRTEDLMKQHLVRFGAVAGLLFVSFLSEVHARRVLKVRFLLRTLLSFCSKTSRQLRGPTLD